MKKILFVIILALAATPAIAQTESYVQLPPNSTGVKLRMRCNTIISNVVCSQGFFIDDGSGSGALGLSGNPIFVNFVAGATTAITASSLPLPSGASTDATTGETHAASAAALPSKSDVVAGSDYGGTPAVRLVKVDSSGNLYVVLQGSGQVIGHVIVDSGSITATQSSGANLHVNVDSTPTTTVQQATAANLNATVVGVGSDNTADSTSKMPTLPCRANAAQPSWTEGNMVPCSTNLSGDTRVSVTNGSIGVTGTVTANAGANLNTSALALESGGNLATVNTNTAPLVVASAGGYVRQDSTATIAKETGGNLTTIATNTTGIATAANQATQISSEQSIDSKMPALRNGAQPVIVMMAPATPPVLTSAQLANPLLYRAAMKQFCSTNLCPPTPIGR